VLAFTFPHKLELSLCHGSFFSIVSIQYAYWSLTIVNKMLHTKAYAIERTRRYVCIWDRESEGNGETTVK